MTTLFAALPSSTLSLICLLAGVCSATASPDVVLKAEPFTLKSLGLSIRLPQTSRVQVDNTAGQQKAINVVDASQIPAWRLRVQEMTADRPNSTAAELAEAHLERLKQLGSRGGLISNEPIQCGEQTGQVCYLERAGAADQNIILGYLFLPSGERKYLLFAILTTPEDFPKTREMLEASFATIYLLTADARSQEWRLLAEAGREFLKSLTPERLKSVVGLNQCLRVHRSGSAGDTELGWSVVSTHAASKQAVGAENPADPKYAQGPDQGLLLFIRGRLAVQPERDLYQDFTIRYWMAWDQSSETWDVRATARQGEAARGESEVGVRNAPTARSPRPMLTVIHSSQATRSREPYEWPVPRDYMSQALGWLLGRLLPRAGAEATTYAYYFYNSSGAQPELSLRTDRWEPVGGGSGQWRLTTKVGVDAPPSVSVYDSKGSLVRQTREDGSIVEPAEPDALERLWRSKGLKPGGAGR